MVTTPHDDPAPAIRFKRRKLAHPKRVYGDEEISTTSEVQATGAATLSSEVPALPIGPRNEDDAVPNLKDIIRNRRRPRDRPKEVARKAEAPKADLVSVEAPRQGLFTGRFVAQTGQVVDKDDKQMTKYVDARLAEQNFRQYGWPIPTHLQSTVAEIAPDLRHALTASLPPRTTAETQSPTDAQKSTRLAVGMGKIEEVDIAPVAQRADEKWRRMENGEFEQVATGKIRLGRDGKPRRPPKRRNSEDIRRDQLVEAVLSESKLDYFDAPANSHRLGGTNNDEAILAQFQADYYESIEEARQQHRKPPPTAGVKGAKEVPKGPKLGGSKSARAKMRLAEEQAAKAKR